VYIYNKQQISKGMFDDDKFRAMCQAFYEVGGGRDTVSILRRHALLKYVNVEFECFRKLCKILGQDMLEYSEGNPFCQEMDNGATLANQYKFLAVRVQLIDPLLQRNHPICLGMWCLKGGTHEQNVEAIEFCTERAFGMSTKQIAHSRIADSADKGISKLFELSEDVCGMYNVDKVGQSATGRLTRSKDKKVINPFPEDVLLLKKVHKQAVYFSQLLKRWENMMEVADRVRCVSVSCIVRIMMPHDKIHLIHLIYHPSHLLILHCVFHSP